jgi:4-hydroxymandelate oxidase
MAFQKMAHPDGEAGVARAVGARGLVMTLSTLANTTIEDVAAAATGPMWYQLYVYRDRGVTRSLVERAEAAGYRALVLTVDAPLMGRRIADSHNRFELPPGLSIANFSGAAAKLESQEGKSGLSAYTEALIDPNLTWRDVEWLASITSLPVVVKGVLRGDDAERSLDHGARGVVVSNHGARQLDTVPATIEVLPEIAHAIAGRADVLIDGGVRRGTDVIKALALGADMVLVGRPLLWGLTLGGEAGAGRVLDLLLTELDLALALCGCRTIADVTPDLVFS